MAIYRFKWDSQAIMFLSIEAGGEGQFANLKILELDNDDVGTLLFDKRKETLCNSYWYIMSKITYLCKYIRSRRKRNRIHIICSRNLPSFYIPSSMASFSYIRFPSILISHRLHSLKALLLIVICKKMPRLVLQRICCSSADNKLHSHNDITEHSRDTKGKDSARRKPE